MSCHHLNHTYSTFSFTLARAISSFHLCCSASSRDLLRLEMVCWSSLFSLLIRSTSAGVNFWFCRRRCSSFCSCFRDSRWLPAEGHRGKQKHDEYEIRSNPQLGLERGIQSYCRSPNKPTCDHITDYLKHPGNHVLIWTWTLFSYNKSGRSNLQNNFWSTVRHWIIIIIN